MKSSKVPFLYWRLSGFYFFYFASLGALVPYWSLYLKDSGFSVREISELMALILLTKIIAPNIWGWIADHTGKRMLIVRIGSLLAAVIFATIFLTTSYWWIALVMLSFSFFWNAALPQFEVTTLQHLDTQPHRYSSIRLWGSVGFIISVASLGYVLQHYSITLLPLSIFGLMIGIMLMSFFVPERAAGHLPVTHIKLKEILLRPEVVALIVVCFLSQASHGAYYTFYTLYMEDYGYSRSVIGQLWALGVVAEVIVFLVMHRLVPIFGLRKLFLITFVLTTFRWILIAVFADSLEIMLLAQILHAASFGIFHAVAIQLFHQHFSGRHAGQGQALYSSVSFGAGGAFGTYLSGVLWESSSPESSFWLSAIMGVVAFFVVLRWIQVKKTAVNPHS